MGNCTAPGPTGFSLHVVDEGTLCRSATPSPRTLGLDALTVDESFLETTRHAIFINAIHEALRRGARHMDLWVLASKYRSWLSQSNGMGGTFGSFRDSLESDWIRSIIELENSRYEIEIDQEMSRIAGLVGEKGQIKDKDDYRYRVRPLYYSHGYVYPANFLEKVRLERMPGKFDVWVHGDLAALLSKVPAILEAWSSGLASRTAAQMRSALGIQIRTIAGKESLSNHAFGLAIDIDAYSNPHIVTAQAIDVLNWVVRRQGIQFDFGKLILSTSERGHTAYTEDDVMEVFNRATTASEIVRTWLANNLPRYRKLIEDASAGEKELGDPKMKLHTKLEDRSRLATAAEYKALARAELKSPDKTCEPASPFSPDHVAGERVRNALRAIEADEDLKRIQLLYQNFDDEKYVKTWETRGILTVPLYLACALVAKLGLRWGEQYESSKDAMHFELMGKGSKPYIAPEIPLHHEKPRTLKRLMDAAFLPSAQQGQLQKPELLKQHARRGR